MQKQVFSLRVSWALMKRSQEQGQIFKNALIELKFINNDPHDILSILDIF